MEYLYTVHTKLIDEKNYYFVKKMMAFPEMKGLAADVVIGFGMHTDFEKACHIAGIDDAESRKTLLAQLEHGKPQPEPEEKQATVSPHQVADHKRSMEKGPAMEVSEMVHRWLIQHGTEVLN
jgi:hypothetical protein